MHPKDILARFEIEPKKSLGQNFLFDERILQRIVNSAEVTVNDQVLEIGPGIGALTRELAKVANHVTAVELDDRLLPVLSYELAAFDNIDIIHSDILKVSPESLFDAPYVVVANVPYYITGAILRHLTSATAQPSRMVLTMQKEVAERLCAKPGNMSLLAVGVQFYGTPRVVQNIAAGAFWPRPKVASSVVRIDISAETPPVSEKALFRLAKAGFSQKRKQLKNNLRGINLSREQVDTAMSQAQIDGKRRAETLSIPEWIALTQAVGSLTPPVN